MTSLKWIFANLIESDILWKKDWGNIYFACKPRLFPEIIIEFCLKTQFPHNRTETGFLAIFPWIRLVIRTNLEKSILEPFPCKKFQPFTSRISGPADIQCTPKLCRVDRWRNVPRWSKVPYESYAARTRRAPRRCSKRWTHGPSWNGGRTS